MNNLERTTYWDDRARRFAAEGAGWRAVCSYGMPAFYNAAIELSQRLALARWLEPEPGSTALDLGCGIGRWSRLLAQAGAQVTGVDLSPTMVEEAGVRSRRAGLDDACRFQVGDLPSLALGRRFDLVLAVTVLQHILDDELFDAAVARIAEHLQPGGRAVLLEAAPTGDHSSCDSAVFTARSAGDYLATFARHGLRLEQLSGVDPAPFKTWFLPTYGKLPRRIGNALLLPLVAISVPIDVLAGRLCVDASWHKVFVLRG